MKKIAILVAAFVLSAPVFAQVIPGAGYLSSTFTSGNNISPMSGFYVGASVPMDINGVKGLAFVPGIYGSFVSSSSSSNVLGGLISESKKGSIIDLNIPAYFMYTMGLSGGARLFAYAGPSVQFGLTAPTHSESTVPILGTGKSDGDLYSGNSGLNRVNVLVGGGLGFGISKFSVNVGYDYGLMNAYRGSGDTVINRANLHVGLGYSF